MQKRLPAVPLMVLAMASLVFAGCAKKAAAPAGGAGGKPAIPVAAAAVRRGDITSLFTLTGTVTPAQQANLSSVISGTVTQVTAQIGQHVRAGQLLVQIDNSTYQAQLQQDEAALASAQAKLTQTRVNDAGTSSSTNANLQSAQVAYNTAAANLRRNQQLLAQGYVSQSAVDQAQQQYSQAQAQLRSAQVAAQSASLSSQGTSAGQADIKNAEAAVAQAQAAIAFVQSQLAQSSITAPFDGVVTQRNVDPGTLSGPNQTVMQVSQLDPIFVNVGIPDEDLKYVTTGKTTRITIDSLPDRAWTGRIRYLNSAAAQGTLSYLARIAISNSDNVLKAGMVANATFVQATHRNVLLVPRVAVAQTESGNVVYIVAGGKAKVIPIRLGVETQDLAEISGPGIAAGTHVITQRPDSLQDGSPVTVVSGQGQGQGGATPYSSVTSQ